MALTQERSRQNGNYTAARQAQSEAISWARLAVVCGLLASAAYTLLSATEASLPALLAICVFGPALAAFSGGLYEVLRLHRGSVSLKLALGANAAAAIAVTMALLAQVGYRELLEERFAGASSAGVGSPAYQAANGIQLGLDLAWDLFLILGVLLFAMNMWSHPRFGRIFALTGAVVAVGLLTFNVATFPEPPGHADLVDLGPLAGLWYLAVTIRIAFSRKWITAQSGGRLLQEEHKVDNERHKGGIR